VAVLELELSEALSDYEAFNFSQMLLKGSEALVAESVAALLGI